MHWNQKSNTIVNMKSTCKFGFAEKILFFIICSVIIPSQIGCFSWFHYILKYRPSFWWVRAHSLFLKNFSVALQVTQSWRLCSRGANLCHKWLNFTWIVSLMDASNNASKHCLVYFMFWIDQRRIFRRLIDSLFTMRSKICELCPFDVNKIKKRYECLLCVSFSVNKSIIFVLKCRFKRKSEIS